MVSVADAEEGKARGGGGKGKKLCSPEETACNGRADDDDDDDVSKEEFIKSVRANKSMSEIKAVAGRVAEEEEEEEDSTVAVPLSPLPPFRKEPKGENPSGQVKARLDNTAPQFAPASKEGEAKSFEKFEARSEIEAEGGEGESVERESCQCDEIKQTEGGDARKGKEK